MLLFGRELGDEELLSIATQQGAALQCCCLPRKAPRRKGYVLGAEVEDFAGGHFKQESGHKTCIWAYIG